MKWRPWWVGRLGLVSGALAASALALPAWAQSYDFPTAQQLSVANRGRTDFQSMGVELGTFILHPAITLEGEYNDNIFYDRSHEFDYIRRLKPSLGIAGDIGDNSVLAAANLDISWNKEFHTEGYVDFDSSINARRDLTDESNISITARRQRQVQPRGSINDPGRAFGPQQYEETFFTLSPQLSQAPYQGSIKLEARNIDYLKDGPLSFNDLNNNQIFLNTRSGYVFDAGYELYLQPSYEIHQFFSKKDTGGLNHDSQTFQGVIGINYDGTDNLHLELGGGYFYQPYFAKTQKNIAGLALQGTGLWNFTDDMSLTGNLTRTTSDVLPFSPQLQTSTEVVTSGLLRLDWQTTDHLLTFAGVSAETDDYPGTTLSEDVFSFSAGGTYYINEYLSLELQYVYSNRFSIVSTRKYDDNRLVLRLNAGL